MATERQQIGKKESFHESFSKGIRVYINQPLIRCMHSLTSIAVARPWTVIASVIALSLGILIVGLFSNFNVDTNEDTLYTPRGSYPLKHSEYIDNESGFPAVPRPFRILVHTDGQNVLGMEGVRRVFEAVDTVRNTTGYKDVCADDACTIDAVTRFWNNDYSLFLADITTAEEAIVALSADAFMDGAPVDIPTIMGNAETNQETGLLTNAMSFIVTISLPESDAAEDFEEDAIDNMDVIKESWPRESGNAYRVEYFTERSFSDEFERAIVNDTVLIPMVFIFMSLFTCFVFAKCDKVQSRSLLGFGAVCSVLLAIMAGFGLLFVIGTPFTSMTQLLPFIMFGIGLDDAFIITGAYFRTNLKHSIEERIHETIEEVGLSIFLTTFTSTLAFGLGAISTIPTVYWLCYYAFTTIILDFLFQLTFFIAVLVIDERRVKNNRRDCCPCCTTKPKDDAWEDQEDEVMELNCFAKMMERYSTILMGGRTGFIVMIFFSGLLGYMIYSTTMLSQEFQFTDVVPTDSYVTDFWDSFALFSAQGGVTARAYFRDVDQSDPTVQEQMEDYINNLVEIDAISRQPAFFWLRDFKQYNTDNGLVNSTFTEQMDAFLGEPVVKELYGNDIVYQNGNVFESRVSIVLDNVDQESVTSQVDALLDQRAVSKSQPINAGRDDFLFFTFDSLYFIWEFYSVARDELILTTVLGVVSVTVVAFVLIPHWSAALFVFPLISMCYIDLLGALQLAGLSVNVVTYITLVMSIGLLVDFLMHVLLAYYEAPGKTRQDKVCHCLRHMGSSVLIGATSTLLGVIPLAFSSSEIFRTVFVSFIALVMIGAGHGLILLPVLLSYFGPLDNTEAAEETHHDKMEEENEEEVAPVGSAL